MVSMGASETTDNVLGDVETAADFAIQSSSDWVGVGGIYVAGSDEYS